MKFNDSECMKSFTAPLVGKERKRRKIGNDVSNLTAFGA